MSDVAFCPECGASWEVHRQSGGCVTVQPDQRKLNFFRVLNGTQWREKPVALPQDRNDIVPND